MQALRGKAGAAARAVGRALDRVLRFRVQRWCVCMKGWKREDVRVLVSCSDDRWYWALLDWLWDWQGYLCWALQWVPLPLIPRIRGHWDSDDPSYHAPLSDWAGDDLGSYWHLLMCGPVSQWIWPRLDRHWLELELTLEQARERLYPDRLRWVEREVEQHERYDAEHPERDKWAE